MCSRGGTGLAPSMTEGTDRLHMKRALELASRGRGWTSPNPMVGAVLVRDGEEVGSGYHERYGHQHAEVNALAQAGNGAAGATLFVTLEPCCVSGNTPPCTEAIIAAGVARVVLPVLDPNPAVHGSGVAALERAGIAVETGLMRQEAERLNAPYFKYRRTGMPFVTLKLAVSLDGRLAPPDGGPRWTSSEESRRLAHAMRAESDCVMVGIGTVLADDPRLTDRRSASSGRQPTRLVLDSDLNIPVDSRVVRGARDVPTIVCCCADAPSERRESLESAGASVWEFPRGQHGLCLPEVLSKAAAGGAIALLCEGGSRIATSLLSGGLVDRLNVFVAPKLYGSEGLGAVERLGSEWWGEGHRFSAVSWTPVGEDVLFSADVVNATGEGKRDGGDVHGNH